MEKTNPLPSIHSLTKKTHGVNSSEGSEEMIKKLVEAISFDDKPPMPKVHIEEFAFDTLGEKLDVRQGTTVQIVSKEQVLTNRKYNFQYVGELWKNNRHLIDFTLFLSIWNAEVAVKHILSSKNTPIAFSLNFPRYPVQVMDTLIRFACMEKIFSMHRKYDTIGRGLLMFRWGESR